MAFMAVAGGLMMLGAIVSPAVETQINLIDIKDIEKRLDQIEIKDKETYNNFITNFEDIKIKYNKLMNDLMNELIK